MVNEMITLREVAMLLKVPKRTLSRWVNKGRFLKANRDYRGYYFWDKKELEEYLVTRSQPNGL